MEILVAAAIGVMTASGVYLMLRLRSFPVVLGLTMITYAVNVFLFASGRLVLNAPPVLLEPAPYADPLPQALVLTAIVIAFGMTALTVILALGSYLQSGTDALNIEKPDHEARRPARPETASSSAATPATTGKTGGQG